jgi:hypothetical protein
VRKRTSPSRHLAARSTLRRAAARTNELEADERRRMIGGGEWSLRGLVLGVVPVPGVWLAEWSHKHPFGAAPAYRAAP